MDLIRRIASLIESRLAADISMCPSLLISSIVTTAPLASCMLWIIFPPGPITAPIMSFGIIIVSIRGACGFKSARGSAIVSVIILRMCRRPSRAWFKAFSKTS